MPRQSKGPRLYLRKGRIDNRTGQQLPDRWFIRDGKSEVGTGCGVEGLDDAERQLAEYIAAKWAKPVGNSDPAQVLVADALALYSMERGPQLKADPATMKGFVDHLNDFWGESVLSDVKRSTCNAYVRHRTGQTIKHGSTGRKVSVQTARRELEVLSAAIGFWDAEHHLTRRPMVVLPEKAESNRDALTRSQAAALLRVTMQRGESSSGRENRAHLRRFILIGLYTGTRSTAIKRLSWLESLNNPWVDLERGIIYRRGRNESVAANKKRPLVKLPPRLLAHLKRWRRMDEAKGLAIVIHHGGAEIGSVRTGFAACAKAAGLSGVTPHWLRHTAATWLMEQNVDGWEAAGYLGMTTATLESHYGHHRPDHQSAARKAMR